MHTITVETWGGAPAPRAHLLPTPLVSNIYLFSHYWTVTQPLSYIGRCISTLMMAVLCITVDPLLVLATGCRGTA